MKKQLFIILSLSTFLAFNLHARGGFGSGFGWGTFTGFATGLITSKMAQANQPQHVVVYREPQIYHAPAQVIRERVVTQPVIAQPVVTQPVVTQPVIRKQVKYVEIPKPESNNEELQIIRERKELLKEENRKRELAIRERELELEILKNKKK